jgi:UDP-N-acetylenolpyruvoylglucosamine reductase
VPLGWVLDKVCHLKGYSDGLVGCYSEQALVLVAQRGATATQVSTFANMIIEKVFEKTRIMIECEVTRI